MSLKACEGLEMQMVNDELVALLDQAPPQFNGFQVLDNIENDESAA